MPTTVEETEKKETGENKKDELLLDSLEIKGYRCFEHLTIEKLGRVNLIVGKNNVGKTALLEALWTWAAATDVSNLVQAMNTNLYRRNEENISNANSYGGLALSKTSYRHLFYNRPKKNSNNYFSIGEYRDDNPVKIKFTIEKERAEVASFDSKTIFHNAFPFLLIPSKGLETSILTELWDDLILTNQEDSILEALKIITDEILDLNFISYPKGTKNRIPVTRVKDIDERIPINSLGEGMSKLLEIALVLANWKDGMVLIDEIENGLHYSILLDVWRLIFKTARELNVQVFAATHSSDCVKAFQRAAEEDKEADGMLIRLVRKGDKIKAILFDEEELETVVENDIEVR